MDIQNSLKNLTFLTEKFHRFSELLQIILQNLKTSLESVVKEPNFLKNAGACVVLVCIIALILYIVLKWKTSELNPFDVV